MLAEYDVIIAGGGCAGLSLLHRLSQSSLANQRILVLDTEPKTRNDKTWCFWAPFELPFSLPCEPRHAWSRLAFEGQQIRRLADISPLQYVHVRSDDFYTAAYASAEKMPEVEFRYETVVNMWDGGDKAYVETEAGRYETSWVFSSILTPQQLDPDRHIYLHQHFGGWFIRTGQAIFEPDRMTLMDFRVPQKRGTAFCYILPFAPDAALVEFTVFSSETWSPLDYDTALEVYLEQNLGIRRYQIEEKEYGSIPMTNHPLAAPDEGRIIQLGTAGGLTKPTTGYTFRRIQEDVEARVKAWEASGSPLIRRKHKPRYAFYDDLLLYLLLTQPELGHGIFEKLFARNHPRTILQFLDEKLSFVGDLWIIGRLPWKPFLQALWKYKVQGELPVAAYEDKPALYMPIKTAVQSRHS